MFTDPSTKLTDAMTVQKFASLQVVLYTGVPMGHGLSVRIYLKQSAPPSDETKPRCQDESGGSGKQK